MRLSVHRQVRYPKDVGKKFAFSEKPLRECPECGKHTLKRLISAPLFRLAGSGWYETDFKSENERKRNPEFDRLINSFVQAFR